jgi:MFS transporter, ACS family, tartrate transporter
MCACVINADRMFPSAAISGIGTQARRSISLRLLPFVFILYVIASLDRVNVGYAALKMTHDLGFTDQVFGFGAGIFFVGYVLLEIPGALIVQRWGARRWIASILIVWGILTALVAHVHTPIQFYVLRFCIGLAEAGFFPGIMVYLKNWFRQEDRASAAALFLAAVPTSNILGSPIAGWLLGVQWYGIPGWRWLFLLEGIPAILFGLLTLMYLTDWPNEARWLTEPERSWIANELRGEAQKKDAPGSLAVWNVLRRREVLFLSATYFLAITGFYGFVFWLPTILKRTSGLANGTVTLLAIGPYLASLAAMLWIGWHSDRTLERRWHTAMPLFVAGAFLLFSLHFQSNLWLGYVSLIFVAVGVIGFLPTFWAMPTQYFAETAAASAIGIINLAGNLGGFVGPVGIGYLVSLTRSFALAMTFLAGTLLLAGITVLALPRPEAHSAARNAE